MENRPAASPTARPRKPEIEDVDVGVGVDAAITAIATAATSAATPVATSAVAPEGTAEVDAVSGETRGYLNELME